MDKKHLSRPALASLNRIAEAQVHLASNPYIVLRRGYSRPFVYSEGIDFEVQDSEADVTWVLMITPEFFDFYSLDEVSRCLVYEGDRWRDTSRERKAHRRSEV